MFKVIYNNNTDNKISFTDYIFYFYVKEEDEKCYVIRVEYYPGFRRFSVETYVTKKDISKYTSSQLKKVCSDRNLLYRCYSNTDNICKVPFKNNKIQVILHN